MSESAGSEGEAVGLLLAVPPVFDPPVLVVPLVSPLPVPEEAVEAVLSDPGGPLVEGSEALLLEVAEGGTGAAGAGAGAGGGGGLGQASAGKAVEPSKHSVQARLGGATP